MKIGRKERRFEAAPNVQFASSLHPNHIHPLKLSPNMLLLLFRSRVLNLRLDGLFSIRSIAALMLLGLFLLQSCDKDAPEPPPFGQICLWDVPARQRYGFQDVKGGPDSVDFIGRVYQGVTTGNCQTPDGQKHPLVIVAHGRIAIGVPYNYLGMTYLTHHLASWGDIVLSLNLDVVNSLQGEETEYGIPHRGELILHAIDYMLAQNRTPGSRFFQQIDTTKIALVGHSRGGGAVIYAANANARMHNHAIKAVATLSPANFGTEALQVPVPHICLYGSWDGDLYEGQGPDLWSRGSRNAPRELVEIYGANHYFFTDKAQFPSESAEITREDHHLLAKGMVNAWFDRYLRGKNSFEWGRYLTGDIRLSNQLEYYVSFQHSEFLPITNNAENADGGSEVKMGRMGTNILSVGLCDLADVELGGLPCYGTGTAVQAGWDARNDRLEFVFAAMDARPYPYLSFRMSQVHGDSLNEVDFKKDFHVQVTDARGLEAKVRVADYLGGLQYPDLSGSLPPDDPNNRKQIMRGFRIPVADFQGIDFSQVTGVKFVFDRPAAKGFDNLSGAIKVADLEFSN